MTDLTGTAIALSPLAAAAGPSGVPILFVGMFEGLFPPMAAKVGPTVTRFLLV